MREESSSSSEVKRADANKGRIMIEPESQRCSKCKKVFPKNMYTTTIITDARDDETEQEFQLFDYLCPTCAPKLVWWLTGLYNDEPRQDRGIR